MGRHRQPKIGAHQARPKKLKIIKDLKIMIFLISIKGCIRPLRAL